VVDRSGLRFTAQPGAFFIHIASTTEKSIGCCAPQEERFARVNALKAAGLAPGAAGRPLLAPLVLFLQLQA